MYDDTIALHYESTLYDRNKDSQDTSRVKSNSGLMDLRCLSTGNTDRTLMKSCFAMLFLAFPANN